MAAAAGSCIETDRHDRHHVHCLTLIPLPHQAPKATPGLLGV
jgi:hypothetical protein